MKRAAEQIDLLESEPPRAFVEAWHEYYDETATHTPSRCWYDALFPGTYQCLKMFFMAGYAAGCNAEPLIPVKPGEAGSNRVRGERRR